MIAMSTLHTSCSVSVDPQQQALFAIQCLISPRKHRIMPLQAHRVNVTHLGTTRRSDEPARSVGHVVHTACCAQCVCKYNCFSQVDEPSTSYYASGMGLLGAPRPPNPLKPKPRIRLTRRGWGYRALSDASLPCITRNCVTAYYRVCIRPLVNASVQKRGGTFDNLCDYCATKFRYFSVRLAQTVSRCPKGYNSEG